MTTYRVGSSGAVVLDAEGNRLCLLPPGSVVVPGTTETTCSDHAACRSYLSESRRIRPREDKRLRAGRDYDDKGA
jgi:hypothetical protein